MLTHLLWFIESSGPVGLGILLPLSICLIATVSRSFLEMRAPVAMPPPIMARCEALLEQRDFKGIFGVVKEDDSFFSAALAAGISELPNGLAEARETMTKVGESIAAKMAHKISPLIVIGTLGPLIGLLGAMAVMIPTLGGIARSGDFDASLLARGSSGALLIAFEGVFLAVPAIYFYALFRNRVSMISAATMILADQFLRHFARAASGKAAGPGTQTTAAAKTALT